MQAVSAVQNRLHRLNTLLGKLWLCNPFYARHWRAAGLKPSALSSLEDFSAYPFTTRTEFLDDIHQHPPLGSNLSEPADHYKRFHRSSGTTHAPIYWADTAESWSWLLHVSKELFRIAGITANDRIFLATPLGRSLGPASLYEGAIDLGAAALNPGTTNAAEQLEWLSVFQPTVLVAKPEALQLLAAAPKPSSLQKLVLTGPTPPDFRNSLYESWNIEFFDRYGLTEAGSVASECPAHSGRLHLLDDEFIAESFDPETGRPAADGHLGELVLTNLGRHSRPIIRYRTGDFVRLIRSFHCPCGRNGTFLKGNITRDQPPDQITSRFNLHHSDLSPAH
jgi:phenylacetate-CoA ligase